MRIALLGLFLLVFFNLPANSASVLDAGDQVKMVLAKQKLYGGQYIGALNLYKEILAKSPNDAAVLHYVGLCHFFLKQYDKALEYFTKAKETNTNVNNETYFYIGKIFQTQGKFDDAITEYGSYKTKTPVKDQADLDVDVFIEQCKNAKTMMASPIDVKIENMGPDINTKYDDKTPCISADGMKLVFTSRRPETTNSPMDIEGDGKYFEDIYISHYDTLAKKWGVATDVPGSVNTEAHDACTSISPDGKQLFLYKNDTKDAESRGGDIFVSKVVNEKWRTPETMGKPINSSWWEGGACISPDGKTLFFTSERDGGYGSSDIWMIKRINKHEWGKPENIGKDINTPYDEVGVFLAPDGKTLFFCSNGPTSMGSHDIFKSTLENGKWSKPVNLGYPINSERSDGPFVLSATAQTGYFASDRDGGLGEIDIYKVDLSNYAILEKDFKKKENNGLSILKGVVRDGYEGYGLPEVEITFTNSSGEKVGSTITNENGEYFITLKGGMMYTLTMKKKGFSDLSETVELKLGSKETYVLEKEFLLKK